MKETIKVIGSKPSHALGIAAQVTIVITKKEVMEESHMGLHMLVARRLGEAKDMLFAEMGFDD
jgi:hypothetical protein